MPKYKDKPLPVFAAMRNVEWKPQSPDYENLLFTATIKRAVASRFGVISAHAHVEGLTLCTGELTFSFLD